MFIEDDDFLSEMLVRKFNKEGFNTSLFKTASEALTSLQSNHESENVDLILLDIILPGMDGFEFLKKVKSDPKLSSVPIIMLSNLGEDAEIRRAKELGAKDYIVKAHFSLEDIANKIKNLLGV